MGTHSSILAWEIPWTEEPDGLQPVGSQRVGHNLATKQQKQQNYIVAWCMDFPVAIMMYDAYPCSLSVQFSSVQSLSRVRLFVTP